MLWDRWRPLFLLTNCSLHPSASGVVGKNRRRGKKGEEGFLRKARARTAGPCPAFTPISSRPIRYCQREQKKREEGPGRKGNVLRGAADDSDRACLSRFPQDSSIPFGKTYREGGEKKGASTAKKRKGADHWWSSATRMRTFHEVFGLHLTGGGRAQGGKRKGKK